MNWIISQIVSQLPVVQVRTVRCDTPERTERLKEINQRYYRRGGKKYQAEWRKNGGWARWYEKNREKKVQYLRDLRLKKKLEGL